MNKIFSEYLQAFFSLMKCRRDNKLLVTYLPDKALRSGHSWKKKENQERNMEQSEWQAKHWVRLKHTKNGISRRISAGKTHGRRELSLPLRGQCLQWLQCQELDLKYYSEKKRGQGRGADRQYQQNSDGKFLLLYLCAQF